MGEAFSKVASYLNYLRDEYNVQICIKDFCGFIPINKELDRALQPFLAHTKLLSIQPRRMTAKSSAFIL